MGRDYAEQLVSLPDFRNLGTVTRILLISEIARIGSLVASSREGLNALGSMANWGGMFEVALLLVVLMLFVLSPYLSRFSYRVGSGVVATLAAGTAGGAEILTREITEGTSVGKPFSAALVAALLSVGVLIYFNWRQRVLSPALAEARLMALQSRIRPHFLFNCINTVLSLVRQDPRLAEQVLLDMADLFRVLLSENRALVPLGDEVRLATAYLQIEQLRLGDRLAVDWKVMELPANTVVPVLLLQPLLENAVYHGIERAPKGGRVSVAIERNATKLVIMVRNPLAGTGEVAPGNRMALANIRERLALHFDAEATLRAENREGEFVVTVALPVVSSGTAYANA